MAASSRSNSPPISQFTLPGRPKSTSTAPRRIFRALLRGKLSSFPGSGRLHQSAKSPRSDFKTARQTRKSSTVLCANQEWLFALALQKIRKRPVRSHSSIQQVLAWLWNITARVGGECWSVSFTLDGPPNLYRQFLGLEFRFLGHTFSVCMVYNKTATEFLLLSSE